MAAPKLFISFDRADQGIATRLLNDLVSSGADVWKFDVSAIPGTDAWDSILRRIENSDFVLALLSAASAASAPVREEIGHAHYVRINSPLAKPQTIPVLVERDAPVPPKLAPLTRVFLAPEYGSGLLAIQHALGLDYRSAFDGEMILTATKVRNREFQVKREVRDYVTGLFERHPEVSHEYQKRLEPTRTVAGGRFHVGAVEVIEWLVLEHTLSVRSDDRGGSESERVYLVRQQAIFGHHHGYSVDTNVVVRVRAKLTEKFSPADADGNFQITEASLRLDFEGFRDPAL